MKGTKRLLSLALALLLALGLLPGAALGATGAGDDPRIIVTDVTGTSSFTFPPNVGDQWTESSIGFDAPEGAPYRFPTGSGSWMRNGESIYRFGDFFPGTWQYTAQVRIDQPAAQTYRLPCSDDGLPESIPVTINGETWSLGTRSYWYASYSFAWIMSPAYVLEAAPGTPLTFRYSADFDIPETHCGTAIQPFSVADYVWGGTAPYTFSRVNDHWLQVSADGTVSGTPDMAISTNADLVIRVTDAAGATADVALSVGRTWPASGDREIVSAVSAAAEGSLVPIPGESSLPLSFTVPDDAVWTIGDNHYWCRYDETQNKWIGTSAPFVLGARYKYRIDVQIDGYNSRLFRLDPGGCSLTVNGQAWEAGAVRSTGDTTYFAAYSPEVTCTGIIITPLYALQDSTRYAFDGNFYPTDDSKYVFDVEVPGAASNACTFSVSGAQGDSSVHSYGGSGFTLTISDAQTQPLTITVTSVDEPSRTVDYTVEVTPRPEVFQVFAAWDPAQLRLSAEMTRDQANTLFRNLLQPVGDSPHGFGAGEQAYLQLRYSGITVKNADGKYERISDTITNPELLDPEETYYLCVYSNAEWPYTLSEEHPPAAKRMNLLNGGGMSAAENAAEVVVNSRSCFAYFPLPHPVTEKLWVEEAEINYDRAAAHYSETMTGSEATEELRANLGDAPAGAQAAPIIGECYVARREGDSFLRLDDSTVALGSGEFYAVFILQPANGNHWNFAAMTDPANPTWPVITAGGDRTGFHWIIQPDDDVYGRVAFADRLNVAPACPAPRNTSLVANQYGMVIEFRWGSPGHIEEGNPEPDCYRVERKVGDGGWETVDLVPYEYDAVGQNHGYVYADTQLTEGETYYYRVRTENAYGCSAWITPTTNGKIASWNPPAAPKDVAAAQTGAALSVSWTEAEGAQSYVLLRHGAAEAPGSFWPSDIEWETVAEGSSCRSPYLDEDVTVGWTYTYKVAAVNGANQDNVTLSSSLNARKMKVTVSSPSAPENLTAELADGIITLSWDDIPGSVVYWVERAEAGPDHPDYSTLDSEYPYRFYRDDSFDDNIRYIYRVRADFGSGFTEDSRVEIYVPPRPIGIPSPTAVGTEEGIRILWGSAYNAAGYYIHRSEDGGEYVWLADVPETGGYGNNGYLDSSAVPGRSYTYMVTPYNPSGTAPASCSEPVTRPAAALSVADLSDYVGPLGSTASFTAEATGDGLSYQWYVKNRTATRFSKSSITAATYSVTLTEANSGRQLYCVVTDAFGDSVQTNTVTMTIGAALTVADLTDYVGPVGSTASFTAVATGDGLTYQWWVKKPTASSFSKSSIKTATYSVELTEARNGNQVYCVVTDAYGSTVQTNTVSMTIG
ncbi:MAG: hypothetical protein IKP17_08525, partial [Oscillospiraceae bacterium]|nr:hypothetical protein [Oscillospiraceae bacterium]